MSESLSNLKNMNVDPDAYITFNYSDGTDVWHCNETHVDDALEKTDVPDRAASALATLGSKLQSSYGASPLESMRDSDLLEDYERGSYSFEEFLAGVIRENFYDCDEFIEEATERFDHKRGFTTLTCSFSSRASDVLSNLGEYGTTLSGWQARVKTPTGTLTFDV